MLDFEKDENKKFMLEEMENNCWDADLDDDATYEEIEEAYNEMLKEFESAEDAMYPNGRDYDAEDFDD